MINSVEKAMKILTAISDGRDKPVPLALIAKRCDIPKPTCSHILKTLLKGGYVVKASRLEGYSLGPMLHYLARYGRYERKLVTLARPVLRWLEKKTGATAVLSVIEGGKKFIIDYADSEQNLYKEHTNILTDDIYRTATGRIILAYMNECEVREIYAKLGAPKERHWEEVTSYESLTNELEKIRTDGIASSPAIDLTEALNAVGYAVPIFKDNRCAGAVGIALKRGGEGVKEKEAKVLTLLKKGKAEIERRLSFEE